MMPMTMIKILVSMPFDEVVLAVVPLFALLVSVAEAVFFNRVVLLVEVELAIAAMRFLARALVWLAEFP